VCGHIQEADGVRLGPQLLCPLGTAPLRALPADTPEAQAGNFIAAQAREEPHQGERPDQLHRIELPADVRRQIRGLQVEPCPQQLGPEVVRNDAGVRPNERADTPRRRQGTDGIEAARDPLPLLAVMKEGADRHDVARLRARR
jgi:hypothetical protein